jgi:hypothetical protein
MKNIKPEVLKNLPPTSETGRYFVHSSILNKTFCIEPIGDHPDNVRSQWGDVNPATKKLETGDYGDKHKGSIKMKDSIIKKENGFETDGVFLGVGTSPEGYIFELEQEFLRKQKEKNA